MCDTWQVTLTPAPASRLIHAADVAPRVLEYYLEKQRTLPNPKSEALEACGAALPPP